MQRGRVLLFGLVAVLLILPSGLSRLEAQDTQQYVSQGGTFQFSYPVEWIFDPATETDGGYLANSELAVENGGNDLTTGQLFAWVSNPILGMSIVQAFSEVGYDPDQSLFANIENAVIQEWGEAGTVSTITTLGGRPAVLAMSQEENSNQEGLFILAQIDAATFFLIQAMTVQGEMSQFESTLLSIVDSAAYTPPTEQAAIWWSEEDIVSMAFSPDGTQLASSSEAGVIRLWDVASGTQRAVYHSETDSPANVAFNHQGNLLAFGDGSAIQILNLPTGEILHTLTGHENEVSQLAFNPDGTLLASGGSDNTIRLWQAGSQLALWETNGAVDDMAFSPDGTLLASGSYDSIRLWQVSSGTLLATIENSSNLAFSPDGTLIAHACEDGEVCLWNVASGTPRTPLAGDYALMEIASLAFSPNGTVLAAADEAGNVLLWAMATGTQLRLLESTYDEISDMTFSPDGAWLITGTHGGAINFWDVAQYTQ